MPQPLEIVQAVINFGLTAFPAKGTVKGFGRNIFGDIHGRIRPVIMAMATGQMPNHFSMRPDGWGFSHVCPYLCSLRVVRFLVNRLPVNRLPVNRLLGDLGGDQFCITFRG